MPSTTLYYRVLLCHKVLHQYCCTTKCQSSTILHYKSNYYSSAALSYKVLLQHYKVLLQHYAVYYRALLQYYPVLQSITPVLLCAPECYTSSVGSAGVRAPRGAGTPALPNAGVPVPRRLVSFEKRLLMCKTQQLTVPEPDAQQRAEQHHLAEPRIETDLPLTWKEPKCKDVASRPPKQKRNKKDWGNLVPICQGAVGVVVSHPLSMREALGSIPIAAVIHCGVWLCSVSAYSRTIKSWTLEFLIHSGFLCSGAEGLTQVHR